MARLRLPFQRGGGALTAGWGISGGPFEYDGVVIDVTGLGDLPDTAEWDFALWSNAEFGLEAGTGPTQLRFYAGYGWLLNDYDRCDGPDEDYGDCRDLTGLPYLGASLGWRLW
jgi:hypothetical protein